MTKKVNTDPKLIHHLLTRGVENVYPSVDNLEKVLKSGKRLRIYNGIDPTGPNLHLGHAVVLRKLRELQDLGHEVIMLIGDFTGMIGDPTDKSATRVKLTRKQVLVNCKKYKKQASKILRFSGANAVKLMFNSKWLSKLKFADIVELASEFTVQQMLERDMFEKRIEEGKPVHLHEFLYPLMQGYDSVALDIDIEVGGNDQTFNMLAGRTMQKNRGREKFVLTTKLLSDPTGKKMGKTEGNMITLTDSATEMCGKVMSWSDEMIVGGFEILTDVPDEEVEKVKRGIGEGHNPREYKMQLAKEIVRLYHGASAADKAEIEFNKMFRDKEAPADMPEVVLASAEASINAVDLFLKAGLASSKSEARRLVEQGGLFINDVAIASADEVIEVKNGSVLKRGKRQFAKVIIK
ncbi:MAG: tyrosine--tRNA ligase [Patescibacteria group bacterium]|jgi:tyrosyl-tRNA synthetase